MATTETHVSIRPYGRGGFFNGCEPRKASSIWELPADVTERFIDVLNARDAEGEVDVPTFHDRITPIGEEVTALVRDRIATDLPEPLCRKGSVRNCGISISNFTQIVFQPETGPLQPHIPTDIECANALIPADRLEKSGNLAEAPSDVENASPSFVFEAGCYAQINAVAELAGQLMQERLVELETAHQQ